jgi:5-methylcytosine-specific restriction endonuclease McrA
VFAAVSPPVDVAASPAEPHRVPLERVEAQICELAGHLAAATCRFLVLLADFDARRGWASWEMGSCAQWLSWKCQMSSGTAREHVRVARALRDLPVIRARFAAGRLSYAKVRALTRIATPGTEAGLAELAGPMTANQLERFARAHRQVTAAGDTDARVRRRLVWRFEEDGSLSGTFRLPPLQGAVLLKALRAACADLAGDPSGDVSAETPAAAAAPAADGLPAADASAVRTSSDLADGLVAVAGSFLAGKVAGADDPEIYQVVVHAGTGVLAEPPAPAAEVAGVSAETPAVPPPVPGDPADPARCHVEDGPAISVSTAQMLACTAALSWMTHGDAGAVLSLGRRRRRPGSAIRRAARERDHGRCRFPGCESRRTDLHHIRHWVNGGRTDLDNLVSLCPRHHKVVHDRGYTIAARPGGAAFAFYRPGGSPLPPCPPLPGPDGPIDQAHDADITPDTIIPPWYGERLDLHHAIWACFANARTREERDRGQDGDPADRGRVTVYEPEDCDERYRQYLEHTPRHTGPTLIPIQV